MRVDYDEDRRWIAMHRGSLSIVCNFGTEPAEVPVAGEVVLASAEPTTGESTTLQGHSFVILRTVER
jgi:maltooligosyltrehalose trehalohydrolase